MLRVVTRSNLHLCRMIPCQGDEGVEGVEGDDPMSAECSCADCCIDAVPRTMSESPHDDFVMQQHKAWVTEQCTKEWDLYMTRVEAQLLQQDGCWNVQDQIRAESIEEILGKSQGSVDLQDVVEDWAGFVDADALHKIMGRTEEEMRQEKIVAQLQECDRKAREASKAVTKRKVEEKKDAALLEAAKKKRKKLCSDSDAAVGGGDVASASVSLASSCGGGATKPPAVPGSRAAGGGGASSSGDTTMLPAVPGSRAAGGGGVAEAVPDAVAPVPAASL